MVALSRLLALAGVSFIVSFPAAAIDLFNNTNTGGVQNGAKGEVLLMTPTPVHVTELVTYHWNNGRGAKPGTLTLKSMSGPSYGPFPAKGTAGQGNAPNVNWIAEVNLTLPPGTYQLIDSDPATWSQNTQTHGIGFAIIRGERQTAGAAPKPPTVAQQTPSRLPPTVVPSGQPPAPKPGAATPSKLPPVPVQPAPSPIKPFPGGAPAPAPGGTPAGGSNFQPCFTNAGSIAALSPCQGAPGTKISIKLSRAIKTPLVQAIFKPYQVRGIPGATAAQVIAKLNGNATAAGSMYEVDAPQQLCLGGGGSWDVFLLDKSGTGQGDIGRFTVDCRSGAKPTGGSPIVSTTPPPPAPAPTTFKPCFTNSGSIAASSPCNVRPGDIITVKLSRALKSPLAMIQFKPYQVTGIPGATAAQVVQRLTTGGTAAGTTYNFPAPAQLCLAGNGSWDLWPIDANGKGQGDIGRVNVQCH